MNSAVPVEVLGADLDFERCLAGARSRSVHPEHVSEIEAFREDLADRVL
ncbi:hypothetical protein [Bradyrhizobium japonicum]|jgi:hypothetical protein|nr:hypothetical protein [Bradyrhizobium japonicum]